MTGIRERYLGRLWLKAAPVGSAVVIGGCFYLKARDGLWDGARGPMGCTQLLHVGSSRDWPEFAPPAVVRWLLGGNGYLQGLR